MKGDPGRWVDGADVDEALQVDLARASEHDVGYDVDAGLARFEASIAAADVSGDSAAGDGGAGGTSGSGAGGPGGGAAAAGTAAASGGAGKAVLTIVGIVAIAGLGVVATSGGDKAGGDKEGSDPSAVVAQRDDAAVQATPASTPQGAEAPGEPAQVPQRVPLVDEAAAEGDAPEALPVEPEAPAGDAEPTQPVKSPPRPTTKPARPTREDLASTDAETKLDHADEDDEVRREMAATDEARRALARDPAKALRLVREADADFPRGLFREQRRGIAALAELALGHGDAAAVRYLDAHPKGTYADKIRKTLDAKKP